MPLRPRGSSAPAAAPVQAPPVRRGGLRPRGATAAAPPPAEDEGVDLTIPGLVAGAAGAGALALTRNPAAAKKVWGGVKTAGRALQDARIGSMLSGLAMPKSLLGNLGATTMASIERGSMAPLKALLSPQTLRDAKAAWRTGANAIPGSGPLARLNLPARVMGSMDAATQKALVRSGVMHDPLEVSKLVQGGMSQAAATTQSAERAAMREVLQSPLPKRFSEALDTVPGQYLIPFRRTPFNQFIEGMKTLNPEGMTKGRAAALGLSTGSGYVTGRTAEDPRTLAVGTAAMGRYGLPFAAASAVGRLHKTGSKRSAAEAIQGMSPVSEYSLSQGVLGPFVDPTNVLPSPAAGPALRYLRSLAE